MRIGFVLADLSTGSAASFWPSIASMFPDDGKDTLVVFSGGRLKSSQSLERMRNSIYSLVRPSNLDGSIIWCSSLTGAAKPEDVLEYFNGITGLPMVTIDGKTDRYPKIPDVRFDAYNGSRFLVQHCIDHHGAKRIAYIRGPENHNSANERYQAYVDTLEQNGLQFDSSIVSEPNLWTMGAESMRDLLEVRHKRPGRDYDTIMCASDLIMYAAAQELDRHGYRIGVDVAIVGFNDSLESRMLQSPATTIRLPYGGLGKTAVESFMNVSNGKRCPDRVLPTTPVIRRSCGCHGYDHTSGIKDVMAFADNIAENFLVPLNEARGMMDMLIKNPTYANLNILLDRICANGADVYEVFAIIRDFNNLLNVDNDVKVSLIEQSNDILPSVLDRVISVSRYEDRQNRKAFNAFNNQLLEANTVSDIASTLKRNSTALGYEDIRLVLVDGEKSTLVGDDVSFQDGMILPEEKMNIMHNGVWIVAPLCTETEYMGYLLLKPAVFNGPLCEEIRSVVSSALKSSILFETTRRAQQKAEAAEQARTNFFANVGENLREPLSDILELVDSSKLDTGMKFEITRKILGANNILDLALVSTGELEMNKLVQNIGEVLSALDCYIGPRDLPCLYFDANRIRQAIEMIAVSVGEGCRVSACMTCRGVKVDIANSRVSWRAEVHDTEIALAQKIIYIHGGTCSGIAGGLSFVLPYPTLSGSDSVQHPFEGFVACINAEPELPIEEARFQLVNGISFAQRKRLPAFTGAIYWDSSFKGYNALTALLSLVSNETYRNLPFICMGCPESKSLEDAVRAAAEEKGKTVLQIGMPSDELYHWLQDPEVICCDFSSAPDLFRRHEPGLVIITLDDPDAMMPNAVELLMSIRSLNRIGQVPVIVSCDYLDSGIVGSLRDFPNVLLVNTCMLESDEFAMRIRAILGGAELLATLTGAIVKNAQLYLCDHATLPIARWQVAEEAHVSEDYLTRVFKRELGLSPWDYLNRYRIWLASRLLRNTGMSINDVAVATGFQDQAYFCRVFKKIRGYSPSRVRKVKKLTN